MLSFGRSGCWDFVVFGGFFKYKTIRVKWEGGNLRHLVIRVCHLYCYTLKFRFPWKHVCLFLTSWSVHRISTQMLDISKYFLSTGYHTHFWSREQHFSKYPYAFLLCCFIFRLHLLQKGRWFLSLVPYECFLPLHTDLFYGIYQR